MDFKWSGFQMVRLWLWLQLMAVWYIYKSWSSTIYIYTLEVRTSLVIILLTHFRCIVRTPNSYSHNHSKSIPFASSNLFLTIWSPDKSVFQIPTVLELIQLQLLKFSWVTYACQVPNGPDQKFVGTSILIFGMEAMPFLCRGAWFSPNKLYNRMGSWAVQLPNFHLPSHCFAYALPFLVMLPLLV